MRWKPVFFILVFICLSVEIASADTIPSIHNGLQAHYGFIIPHSRAIEEVSHTNPYGIELSINKLHTSFKKWQIFGAYWISGIQAGYFNFQNRDILGSVYDINIFAEPIISHGRKYFLSVRGGAGLAYHTRIYDKLDNPLNQFFSTRLTFPLFVDVRYKYRVSNQLYLTISGCYNHISNGGFKQPNKGMNFPTLAVGAERFYNTVPILDHNYSSDHSAPGSVPAFSLQAISAVKILEETEEYPELRAFIYGFHLRAIKQISSSYLLALGSEIVFDGYIKELIRREQTDLSYQRVALTAGQEFFFGNVAFAQSLGFYVYSPYKARNQIYQKYELAYRLIPELTAGVFLKAHLHVAEMMGLTLSYSLLKK